MSTIEKTFSNGDIIIQEGDKGNTFFQILEGKVGVYKDYDKENETKLATLEQGQYFGEMAVIESYPRSSTVVADGDVKVLEIAAEEMKEYVSQNPDKILAIMKLLGARSRYFVRYLSRRCPASSTEMITDLIKQNSKR